MRSPSVASNNRRLLALLCIAVVQVPGTYGQNLTNITIPQPFNGSSYGNQTFVGTDLPPLATVNGKERWEPIPHYKHPHYDTSGKVLWFPRIIGGTLATAGEFPAMVSLQMVRNSEHICGGTLLTMNQILTAAHCVTDTLGMPNAPAQFQVMADDLHILPLMSSPTRQVRPVRSIVVHPQYDVATITNDIALVRVSTDFRRTETLFPGKRVQRTPTLGDRCHLAGWGVTEEHSRTMSPDLRRINVAISDFGTCNAVFDHMLTRGMLCASSPGRDACQGDSGGALLCTGGRVAGIVSFGAGCANPNVPGVYVDVVHYEKWINGVLRNGAERPVGFLVPLIMLFSLVKKMW